MGFRNLRSLGYRDTLDLIVIAFCKDYMHRKEAIADGKTSKRTRMEYEYINFRILLAACEVAGESQARKYIDEIGGRIGYAYSDVDEVCESTYKMTKKEVKINIARKLHMID